MIELPEEQIIPANWDVAERVVAFTTTKLGGESQPPFAGFNLADHVDDEAKAVAANRSRLSSWFSSKSQFQWLNQVHGTGVESVSAAGGVLTADALVTSQNNLACCVLTADCLPAFISAKDGSEVAIAHAGWRGLAAGVIENTVAEMISQADQLVAWLGPAIGPCHFEVGSDVVERFQFTQPHLVSDKCFEASGTKDKYFGNLFELVRLRLNSLGVEVFSSELCTVCDPEKFFSYRRDGRTGRMASVILIHQD